MPRTNRTQKYAALWLHSQGWDVSKISNELDLTDAQVKRKSGAYNGGYEKASQLYFSKLTQMHFKIF